MTCMTRHVQLLHCLHALQVVYKWGFILTLILIPIWPLLALPARVFSKGNISHSDVTVPLT